MVKLAVAYQAAAMRLVPSGVWRARGSVVVAAQVYGICPAGVTVAYEGRLTEPFTRS